MASSPSIIYILSFARSGSTLLGNILNSDQRHMHVGEFERMWMRQERSAIRESRVCGCTKRVRECEIWAEVFTRLEADLGLPAEETVFDVFERAHLPPPGWTSTTDLYADGRPELRRLVERLYPAVADVSGQSWVVDSSKSISYGQLLREIYGDEHLHVVHLVRDGRGVLASRLRSVMVKRGWGSLRRLPYLVQDLVDWQRFNRRAEEIFGDMPNYSLVTYDDLIRDLAGVMSGPLARLEFRHDGPPDQVVLTLNHTAHGNRNRLLTGEVTLEEDLRWKTELSPMLRGMVSLIAGRSLDRYGFER